MARASTSITSRSSDDKRAPASAPAPSNFLAQLDAADRAALNAIGLGQLYRKGEFVFRSGGAGAHVYFLASGKVKIYQPSPAGREVILWFCFPGEIFGLAEVARGGGRVVNAVACVPSEILVVPQDRFRALLRTRPEVAMVSMQVLSSRLRMLGEMFVNLVSDDVNTRIAKLVLRLGARYGSSDGKEIRLTVPLTHQEIADMIGTSRQTVTTALSALKRQGVLSIENRLIRIESEEVLSGLAQQA